MKKLSSNQLKIIAVCAMIFDHLLWVIKPGYEKGIIYLLHIYGTLFNQTSIMWSLALGLIVIMINDSKLNNNLKIALILFLCVLGFPSDWSSVAVMIIIYDYAYRNNFKKQMITQTIFSAIYATVYCIFIDFWYGLLQMGTILSIPLLKRYNGERGNKIIFTWKYFSNDWGIRRRCLYK